MSVFDRSVVLSTHLGVHHVHIGSLFCYGRIITREKIETNMEREGRIDFLLNEMYVRNQLIGIGTGMIDSIR